MWSFNLFLISDKELSQQWIFGFSSCLFRHDLLIYSFSVSDIKVSSRIHAKDAELSQNVPTGIGGSGWKNSVEIICVLAKIRTCHSQLSWHFFVVFHSPSSQIAVKNLKLCHYHFPPFHCLICSIYPILHILCYWQRRYIIGYVWPVPTGPSWRCWRSECAATGKGKWMLAPAQHFHAHSIVFDTSCTMWINSCLNTVRPSFRTTRSVVCRCLTSVMSCLCAWSMRENGLVNILFTCS